MSAEAGAADELPIFIAGPGAGPEQLMLVGRGAAGRVRVREWSGADWSAPPTLREVAAADVVDMVERAVRAGRRVNQSPLVVRHWVGDPRP